jgi:DNA/RNA endonuclease YhcR with UshA esterase domain
MLLESKFRIKVFIILLFLIFPFPVYSQITISPEHAINHIGENVTVCGMVASTHYATRTKGQPTFLNLNRPYPGHIFTVLIWGSDRSNFPGPPEVYYNHKKICVTGTIKAYRGIPEIIVKDPAQIK